MAHYDCNITTVLHQISRKSPPVTRGAQDKKSSSQKAKKVNNGIQSTNNKQLLQNTLFELRMMNANDRYALLLSLLLLLAISHASAPPGTLSLVSSANSPKDGQSANILAQWTESLQFTVEATKNSWRAHSKCNEIRAKQRNFRESLRQEWQDLGADNKDISMRLKTNNGGISYDEFEFLQRGNEDRTKVLQIGFVALCWPKVFPIALTWFPGLLPSHFDRPTFSAGETKLEALSRERSHAVLKMILKVEKECRTKKKGLANFIAGKQGRLQLLRLQRLEETVADILTLGNLEPGTVLDSIEDEIYLPEKPKGGKAPSIPTSLIKCFNFVISGRSGFFDNLAADFLAQGQVVNQLRKVTEGDEFLVNQGISLETLSTKSIVDACNARLIGTLGRSEEELRHQLTLWLEYATIIPNRRVQTSGEFFNGNVARSALMVYFALDAVRDERCASALPRILYKNRSVLVSE